MSRQYGCRLVLQPHFGSMLLNEPNRPEIRGKARIHQVCIGYSEVPFHLPYNSPRVSHNKPLRGVVIADREHGMTAKYSLSWGRHRYVAILLHGWLEAIIDGKPKDEWIAGGQAPFHLIEIPNQSMVASCLVLESILIAGSWRSLLKLRNVIWPFVFRAVSLLHHTFDTIPDLRPAIRVDGPLHSSLIIVNEESRGYEVLQSLFHPIEFDCASDGVGCTASQLALVINRWAFISEIKTRWKL